MFVGLAVILLGAIGPAQAALILVNPANGCPQTLNTPGGQYVLTGDLDCSGTNGNGIIITASNVIFHLAGHTIKSTDRDPTKNISGIVVQSVSGVLIDGGTVRGFNDGVFLDAFTANSRVSGMTVKGASIFGMVVSGSQNQVDMSVVTESGSDGIGLGSASGAVITSNDISGNARVGVAISNSSNDNVVQNNIINNNGIILGTGDGVAIFNGTKNLIQNNAVNNNFTGISIGSPGNTVTGNTVNGSVGSGANGVGIEITNNGAPSTVQANTVLGSSLLDMSDGNTNCDGDTWKNNTFQTASPAGQPC
jgi:parallel beta-helix repeat protein